MAAPARCMPLLAEELGITEIVIPPMPGAFSAYGLLTADTRYDITKRLTRLAETTLEDLQGIIEPLREEARERLRRDGFKDDDIRLQVFLDMRFVGQAFELTTEMPETPANIEEIAEAFQAVYEERYAQSDTAPSEIVSFRVVGFGGSAPIALPERPDTGDAAPSATRQISFDGAFIDTPILQRDRLPADLTIEGPAIIEEEGATTVVPPQFSATLDRRGILVLKGTAMAEIDPITLEVVTEGLVSVVREMRATVFRTARSVAIYEARDFSCGLFDAKGHGGAIRRHRLTCGAAALVRRKRARRIRRRPRAG